MGSFADMGRGMKNLRGKNILDQVKIGKGQKRGRLEYI